MLKKSENSRMDSFEFAERIPSLKATTEIYEKTRCDLREIQRVLRNFNSSKRLDNICKENNRDTYNHKSNIHHEDKGIFEVGYKKYRKEQESPSSLDAQDDPYDSEHSSKVAVKSILVPATNYGKKKKLSTYLQNAKVESRNRRMLGMLQGTLQKFIVEAQKEKPEISRRAEIEKKIEKAVEDEYESTLRQKLQEKEDKQIELKCLKKCIVLLQRHELWKRKYKNKFNFILTRAKPHIYFLPSNHSAKTLDLLIKSRNELLKSTEKREQLLMKDMTDIKKSYISEHNYTEKEVFVSPGKLDYFGKTTLSYPFTFELENTIHSSSYSEDYASP